MKERKRPKPANWTEPEQQRERGRQEEQGGNSKTFSLFFFFPPAFFSKLFSFHFLGFVFCFFFFSLLKEGNMCEATTDRQGKARYKLKNKGETS